jgi:hypothetical protein
MRLRTFSGMLLACIGLLLLIGCAMPEQNYGMGHEFGFFAPSFGADVRLVEESSRGTSTPSILDTWEANRYAYAPQLSHFTVIPDLSESDPAFNADLFGRQVQGELRKDYPEAGQYTVTYNFPDSKNIERVSAQPTIYDGCIEIIIRNDGTFSYSQHLIVDLGDDSGTDEPYGIWYLLYEIEDGVIQTAQDTRGSYFADGVNYFGRIAEGTKDGFSVVQIPSENNFIGKVITFIRGNNEEVIAIIKFEESTLENPVDIAEKELENLTIEDITEKLDTIKGFSYVYSEPPKIFPYDFLK